MNEKIPSTRWLRIIVPVLIACIMSFMDRVNISFARPWKADLGITSKWPAWPAVSFLLVIYFCKFPVGELRLTAAVKNLLPGRWCYRFRGDRVCDSSISTAGAAIYSRGFGRGMLPVVLTMVSNWFPEKELGRANAFVMMFAPLGMLTAPVSGLLRHWRWLFIIEGLLSLVVLVVWWFMISDRPQEVARPRA
jgi:hypothetical protein